MSDVDKLLAEEKKRLDQIKAPEQLEKRLRSALDTKAPKIKKRTAPIWIAVAAFFLIVSISYNYNAFAYYGKQLLGFDEVINGTLKELNDEGMGQVIGEQTVLEDGTVLIIDGIMTDANQLVLYYTVRNPNGLDWDYNLFSFSNITGMFTNSFVGSGTSLLSDDQTEIKGTMSFEPVSPFSKKLTLHFFQNAENDQMREDSITFPYNPNKAMQTMIKKSIKKKVKVDKGTVTFNSITATPMSTVIEGTLKVDNFDRVNLGFDGMKLLANGTPVERMGSGSGSSLKGVKFDIRYDTLPKDLDTLQLVMKEFVGYETLNEKVDFNSLSDEQIRIGEKDLWIKNVATTSNGLEITIATDEDVMLDGVSIGTKHEITLLNTTVNQIYSNDEAGREWKERTLLFDTKIEPEFLLIDGMHYIKEYDHVIDIEVD